jgi:hypothetical protein
MYLKETEARKGCDSKCQQQFNQLMNQPEQSAGSLQVIASGEQMWLGVNGQELQPQGAMRQSPTGNDMSRSLTKQQLMKTKETETQCML